MNSIDGAFMKSKLSKGWSLSLIKWILQKSQVNLSAHFNMTFFDCFGDNKLKKLKKIKASKTSGFKSTDLTFVKDLYSITISTIIT
jgi:hypothetical protein